jgi:Membrane protein involved in the export of O-antigen and teichoic acid
MDDQDAIVSPTAIADGAQQFRSQVGHISRNSGVYFAGTIFSVGFGYIFKVYVARVIGAQQLGLYALGMTLVGFVGIFNTLGLPQSAVRFVAEYQASGKFKELHALLWRGAGFLLLANLLMAGVLLSVGKWIAVRFYHAPELGKYLPLFALIMLFGVVNTFYGKVLAGYRDLKLRTVIVSFIGSPLNMLVAVVLISLGLGLRGYLVAQIVSASIVCMLLLAAVRSFTPAAARFLGRAGSAPTKEVWSFSVAMLGIGFLEFLMSQVDKVALGYYRGARQVGIYSVAAALVVYVPLAMGSVNQIFASTIADLHTRGEHALLTRLFQSLTKWVVGLTLPLALVVMLFAQPLMRIFGRDFEVGWPILVIGTVGQLVNCGVGSVGYLLLMSGHEKRLIRVQMAMAGVMLIGSAALVPLWGIYGAALAAAITNIGMNVWNLLEVRRALGMSPYNRSYWHLLLPTAMTLATILVLKRYSSVFHHDWLAVGVTLAAAYCVFPAVFYFMSGLDDDDRLIASALRSRLRGVFNRSGAPA